jgi:hypothetical protein
MRRTSVSPVFFRLFFFCSLFTPVQVVSVTPSVEDLWKIVQQQQIVIQRLEAKLEQTEQKIVSNKDKVEQTANELEAAAEAFEEATVSASTTSSWVDRTTLGGYGELHYNSLDDDNDTIGGNDDLDRIDFHRFVLFFGHEFNDSMRLFSELELEHALAGDGEAGEVELEQAWIELDINKNHRVRAGLDILPIGIINPTHEPNTFYGVERNRIETEIIPATWWEAGLGLIGEIAPGWNYDLIAHSGLDTPTTGSSAFRPRSGRTKIAEADDIDIALTGRVRYTGIPGLEFGVAGQYQRDYTGTADSFDIDATLFEGHIDWKHNSGFGLRALYARWDIGDDNPGADPDAIDADTIAGWYIEPAYRFKSPGRIPGELGIFARYSQWDERNQISGNHRFEEFTSIVTGLNWWPTETVAFKFDYQDESADGIVDKEYAGINLGLGYQF